MPCAAYDDNGKLVMVIAGPGEKPDRARNEAAVTHPETRIIMFCECKDAHPGLADATECETCETEAMVLIPPAVTAGNA